MALTHTAPRAAQAPSTTSATASATAAATRPTDVDRPARRHGRAVTCVSRWWAVFGLLAIWQAWVTLTGFNRIVLPTPLDVATDLVTNPGAYAGDTARTFGLALFGVVVGMALGFAVSVATWASSLVAGAVSPLVLMLRSIPIVAVIPVVARLVGYGNKIVPIVTIMLAFFPAYVMTSSGLRAASPTSLRPDDVARRVALDGAAPAPRADRGAQRARGPAAVRLHRRCWRRWSPSSWPAPTASADCSRRTRVRFETERAWGAALIATALSVLLFQVALRIERWGRHRFR